MTAVNTHEFTDTCAPIHCYSHHIDEPSRPRRDYLSCYECGHLFPTRRALRRDYRRGGLQIVLADLKHPYKGPKLDFDSPFYVDMPSPLRQRLSAAKLAIRMLFIRAKDITFCPHCIHDF
jgi:hypothetical protein